MTTARHAASLGAVPVGERALRPAPPEALRRRYRGCMLGGAVGDALGAPVEFMSLDEIRARFGPAGIVDFTTAFDRQGAITDDTQMSLHTADGLLRAHVKAAVDGSAPVGALVAQAYQRWLATQGEAAPLLDGGVADPGWLSTLEALRVRRVPGHTCLHALHAMPALGVRARNDSKGCGGVMRIAPVGLYCAGEPGASPQRAARRAFDLGCELAGLTHGHPTGQASAGAFAAIVALVVRDYALDEAIEETLPHVARRPLGAETKAAIERAIALAADGAPSAGKLGTLGEGWVAEEALAIALYAALAAPDFTAGVLLAVNHDGDSDSTGAIAGNLLGALHGVDQIPRRWLSGVELGREIAQIADDLATFPAWPIGQFMDESEAGTYWRTRYPPA